MSAGIDTSEFVSRIEDREVNSESTVDKYCRWADRYEAWAPAEHDENALRDFDSFLADEDRVDYPWFNTRGPSPPPSYAYRTRVQALSAVKLWHKHEHGVDVSGYTEVQNICKGEPAEFEPRLLDAGEVMSVQQNAAGTCDNPDCAAAVRLGYDCIMRGAELADVRAEDFDFENRSVFVRAKKGSEPKQIQVSQDVWNHVAPHAKAHQGRDYLFRNAYDRAWSPSAWNQHFRRKHHPAGFHAYARHSACVNRLKEGADFSDVYLRARHQSPQTTIKYVKFVPNMDESGLDWLTQ